MIILDFSKAFDRVPHQHLLKKVHHCGIRDTTYQWISSFLNSRTQQVLVEGQSSEKVPIVSGVPQGSVLGPVLFLIFIDDLPDNINSRTRLFADDCILYRQITSETDQRLLQEDLTGLPHGRRHGEWSSTHRSVVSCASPEHESPETSSTILKV